MKSMKFFTVVLAAGLTMASAVDAVSIGRGGGGGGGGRVSSSFSRPSSSESSFKAPSAAPSPAPAQSAKPGGIGGTQGAMGVRKSDVTAPVAANVQNARNPVPSSTPAPNYNTSPGYTTAPVPSYGPAVTPQYSGVSNGSVFMSSLGGSLFGSMLGNAISRPSGGTTVVNNGSTGMTSSSGQVLDPSGGYVQSGPVVQQQKESYSMGKLIIDVILFAILVALIVGIVYLFYKGFKMLKEYADRERGVGPAQPFNPTKQFWTIQRAFAAADAALLTTLLGPDLVDEATSNLEVTELNLSKVSHQVVLSNKREFSVHYTFNDGSLVIDQVWHYELHNGVWVLNGIETV